jgi:hypothetical protein
MPSRRWRLCKTKSLKSFGSTTPFFREGGSIRLGKNKEKTMDDNMKLLEEPKEAYAKPTLFVHGVVEVITQGSRHGPRHDSPFPGGFKKHDESYS